jgi:hypothetical protein
MPPSRGTRKICQKLVFSSRMWTAGMTKTLPPAMMPLVAPMARMFTFSSRVEARLLRNFTANTEKPTARMEMGMALSMPWPSFRAM